MNYKNQLKLQVTIMKNFTFIIALSVIASAVFAQPGFKQMRNTTPEDRAKTQTEFMKEELNLGKDQAEKVDEINLKYAKQIQEIITGSLGREERRNKIQEISQEKDKELKSVLSEEQYEKYLEARDEMRKKMRERRKRKEKNKSEN